MYTTKSKTLAGIERSLQIRDQGNFSAGKSRGSWRLIAIVIASLVLVGELSIQNGVAQQMQDLGYFAQDPLDDEMDSRTFYQLDGHQRDQDSDLERSTDDETPGSLWLNSRMRQLEANENDENQISYSEDKEDTSADQDLSSLGYWSSSRLPLASSELPRRAIPAKNEIYLLEDKDYPKSPVEEYPRRVGQVAGIATLPDNDVVIFHRAQRQWNETTFNASKRIPEAQQENLIKNDTIMIIDGDDGSSVASFGANLFYMPHSIASDSLGNLWVSDVARHQVMRLPAMNIQEIKRRAAENASKSNNVSLNHHQIWPDIILGEAFTPGTDAAHFCQPSEIAISSNGKLVYVADGYCNQRIMVFQGSTGRFVKSFGQLDNLQVVHSITLFEERNLLCVTDREGARVLCYSAGLDGDLSRMGRLVNQIADPIGRVFAITSISPDHLLVSSHQFDTKRYDLSILNPFTHELKLVWTSTDLLEPHSLATTRDREFVYAADISKEAYKKVFKFDIIKRYL